MFKNYQKKSDALAGNKKLRKRLKETTLFMRLSKTKQRNKEKYSIHFSYGIKYYRKHI